jgi:hypothetical protein
MIPVRKRFIEVQTHVIAEVYEYLGRGIVSSKPICIEPTFEFEISIVSDRKSIFGMDKIPHIPA